MFQNILSSKNLIHWIINLLLKMNQIFSNKSLSHSFLILCDISSNFLIQNTNSILYENISFKNIYSWNKKMYPNSKVWKTVFYLKLHNSYANRCCTRYLGLQSRCKTSWQWPLLFNYIFQVYLTLFVVLVVPCVICPIVLL